MPTVENQVTSTTGSAVAHTAVAENVAVKSIVSTETQSRVSLANTQKMSDLMSRLGILFNKFIMKQLSLLSHRYNSSTS